MRSYAGGAGRNQITTLDSNLYRRLEALNKIRSRPEILLSTTVTEPHPFSRTEAIRLPFPRFPITTATVSLLYGPAD